jgi:GT2 family glycosyltransferase
MVAKPAMNSPRPLVSVCIANYNGEAVLSDCIESVLAQQGDVPFEIIIHDDASSDDSLPLLRERYPADRYPFIRVVESAENVGFCISNNRMASLARGEYLLLLNNDAALAPNVLATLLDASRLQNPQGILSLPQVDWESDVIVDRGCWLDPFYNPIPNLDPAQRDVAMVIAACMWLPRLLWERLGGFPEWFESIAEDMYLCCHARLIGYPVQVTATSFYRHRQGASFGGNRVDANRLASTYRRRRLSERNKTYVMILCSPPTRLWLTLPLHLLLLAMEGATLALLKRDPRIWTQIYCHVFISLRRHSRFLQEERHRIQKRRRDAAGRPYGEPFQLVSRKLQMLLRYGWPDLR